MYIFRSPKEKRANLLSNSSKLKNSFSLDVQAPRVINPLSVEYAWIRDAVFLISLRWLPFNLIAQMKGHLNGRCCGSHLVYVRETAEIREMSFLSSRFSKGQDMGENSRLVNHVITSKHENAFKKVAKRPYWFKIVRMPTFFFFFNAYSQKTVFKH